MPLTDFIRYLNARFPSRPRLAPPFFHSESGRVLVRYRHLCLESEFLPIVETSGGVRGHAARLLATVENVCRRVDESTVFALPENSEEFVFVDRLTRTLHTLNYLTYLDRGSRGLLLLKVHPRHVASVTRNHGLAFEEILCACGLLPNEITLELGAREGDDPKRFLRAIADYKLRGYGIALAGGGWHPPSLDRVREAGPTIVSLAYPRSAERAKLATIRRYVDALHSMKVSALVRGEDHPLPRPKILEAGFDLRTESTQTRLLEAS
ncbi:MAG: hypothetical protein LBD06_04320 [Candidatus Accumulibacter sp.]|jgi:EAL domain-containing protein (putative c-di-GMP-specific phosphodiesterase class I)|nr:hypothetical protein [Accumulibacter sp.]